jgi:hypothetical protein
MKKIIITSILALLVAAGTSAWAQNRSDEYLGLPGDNLNLYAVMKLFQESETLEGFERNLNDENSRINNLDLNGDNLIDYIMVRDYVDGNVHTIVLQVALNQNEKQDVAVFTVQRFPNGSVQIQLIGDEALYGRNYIIEPTDNNNYGETYNPGYIGRTGNRNYYTTGSSMTFEVAAWPLIRFLYLPDYVSWHSSWDWDYYPSYWHPWRPYYWDYYYGYHSNWYPDYYSHYRHWQYNRYTRYNDFYYNRIRSHSQQVSFGIKRGDYRTTYSHPEQRRDGEALFSRMHSGQNRRTADQSSVNSQGRRYSTESTRERTTEGKSFGTYRRSASTVTNRNGINSYSGQNAVSSRRSTPIFADRSGANLHSDQNAGTSRRSTANVTDRSNTNSYLDRNAGKSYGSSSKVSDRTASRPEPGYRGETTRTSRPSTTGASPSNQRSVSSQKQKSVSSPNQRNSKESNKPAAGKRSSDTNESQSSKSSRRK